MTPSNAIRQIRTTLESMDDATIADHIAAMDKDDLSSIISNVDVIEAKLRVLFEVMVEVVERQRNVT